MSSTSTIRGLILRRIVPVTVIALLAALVASRFFAGRVVQQQAQDRIQLSSLLTARQLTRELSDMTEYVKALADNHMIVQALVNTQQQRTQLPPFFRTLRLPNTAFRNIAMFDYAGRPLVANSAETNIDLTPYMAALSSGDDVLTIDKESILVACPIRFKSMRSASTEGVLAARFDTRTFLDRFRSSDQSQRTRVFAGKTQLYADRPFEDETLSWISAASDTSGEVELTVEHSELQSSAFAALRSTDIFLCFLMTFCVAALAGTILYSSRLITQPLESLVEQIGQIDTQQRLADRLSTDGPKEFQLLTDSFNQMLAVLSETTVSLDELQETKDRLQLALAGGNIGMWSWDVIQNTVYVSKELSNQVGEDQAFDSYDTFLKRLHPDDVSETKKAVEDCFAGLTPDYDTTFRLRHRNGKYRWILSRGRVARWIADSPGHMIGVHVDITERIEAEQKLRSINAELERSNEELAQFAYVASHDLQEPLRKIVSFVSLLDDEIGKKRSEDADLFMKTISDAAKRMRTLIQDLLAFSRVESEGRTPKRTDLNLALEEALNDLQLRIESSGAKIEHGQLPYVMADEAQLTQVFTNFLSNAIKYCTEKPIVKVSSQKRNGNVVVRVSDNGIGIEPNYRERVFGIFKRLHGRGDYTGNGIGLAICKRIIERFNGHIWVEDNPSGQGSCFAFELPEARSVEAAASAAVTHVSDSAVSQSTAELNS